MSSLENYCQKSLLAQLATGDTEGTPRKANDLGKRPVQGQNPWRLWSGRLAAAADEVRQVWYGRLSRYAESISEIIPECDAEFGCGAHQMA
jgi:hypothetical protein